MRLRTLLATTVAGTLLAGAAGMAMPAAHAVRASSPTAAGTLAAWGDTTNASAEAAMNIPGDFTAPVVEMATTPRSSAAVTIDGHLYVWGAAEASEVMAAPTDVTDAAAVALAQSAGLVLHDDGSVSGWGTPSLAEVPEGLSAVAIDVTDGGTGFAITTGGDVVTWGTPATFSVPSGLSDLVDIAAGSFHAIALKSDGTVVVWRLQDPAYDAFLAPLSEIPDFGTHQVIQIDANSNSNAVILDDGSIELWGISVPANEPDFDTESVISLVLGPANAGAVTDDGSVYAWGSQAAVNAVPPTLDEAPVSAIAVGNKHAIALITAFRELTAPAVSGTAAVGETLTATPATYSLDPDEVTGQWFADEAAIEGATGQTLTLTADLIGKQITYVNSATRGDDTVPSTSEAVGPVAGALSTTTLTVSPGTKPAGTARTVTATVASPSTNTGNVTFTVGGKSATKPVNAGTAKWTLPKNLAAGSHKVTAAYSGDTATSPSTSAPLTVKITKAKATVKGKAKVAGKKAKKFAKKVTLTITVKAPAGVKANGKVVVQLKGKTKKKVTVKVNAKGKAKVVVKKVKHGKYQAKVNYKGNPSLKTAKTTVKFTA